MLTLKNNAHLRYLHEEKFSIPLRDFSDCKNGNSGSLFLLASGRSATDFPIARYAHFPFIAMNGSICRLVDEGVKPLFYVCDDKGFVKARPEMARLGLQHAQNTAMSLECFQNFHEFDTTVLQERRLYLLERVNRYYGQTPLSDRKFAWSIRHDPELITHFSLLRRKSNRIGFSRNMVRGCFAGRTIVYAATQLAYFLGFRQVFIIGMDLNASTGRFYESGQAALPTSLDQDFPKFILPSFEFMAKYIMAHENFQVFNLSPQSRLPAHILPKIKLDQLDQLLTPSA
jgi:KDO transferase-3